MDKIWDFSEINFIFEEFHPRTPTGRKYKYSKKIINNKEHLIETYNLIEILINFIKEAETSRIEKIYYHLSRIPDIQKFDRLNAVDILQVKKFIFNYTEIIKLVPLIIQKHFKLCFNLIELKNILTDGGGRGESFIISEEYDEELQNVRKKIKKLDEHLINEKNLLLKKLNSEFGLDFKYKSFLVIRNENALKFSKTPYLYIEPYDRFSFIIRPRYNSDYLKLYAKKEELIRKETEIENKILKSLSRKIKKNENEIKKYIKAAGNFDHILEKARLALKYNMCKVNFINKPEAEIVIRKGNLLPLKNACEKMGTDYEPLYLKLNKKVNVIRGANMGGKTVVLKTLAFFQLLAQSGFYVPAEKFVTDVFDKFHFIGDFSSWKISKESRKDSPSRGLSSFGFEVVSVTEALKNPDKKNFYIIDEFARTTNSIEASALTSGLLKRISQFEGAFCFLSTHFMKLPLLQNIGYFIMKGLKVKQYEKFINNKLKFEDENPIILINKFMQYKVLEDDGKTDIFDALLVAEMLGADKKLTEFSKFFLNKEKE
ncbi:MAG: MutS-related protein [Candidatus Muiribacteriota bacterium]